MRPSTPLNRRPVCRNRLSTNAQAGHGPAWFVLTGASDTVKEASLPAWDAIFDVNGFINLSDQFDNVVGLSMNIEGTYQKQT